jgi:hypothetical protein
VTRTRTRKTPAGETCAAGSFSKGRKLSKPKRQEVIAKAAVEAVLALQTQAGTSPTRNYTEANGDNIGDLDSKVYAAVARILGNVNQNSEYTTGHPPERSVNYLIDSGASKHMFPASVPMRNISKCHVPIRLADNSTRQAIATGTGALPTGSPVVPILDITGLRVPGFQSALLSVSDFARMFTIVFARNRAYVTGQHVNVDPARVVATGTLRHGAYYLDYPRQVACVSVADHPPSSHATEVVAAGHEHNGHKVETMPVDVTEPQGPRHDTASRSLHAVFNHAGMDALRQLVRQYPDITAHYRRRLPKQFRSHSKDCDPCHVGKQTRQPFRVSDHDYTDQPLQLIQTDTTGPIQTPGVEGHRYVQLFLDRGSGKVAAPLLRLKSEAAREVLRVIKRWQL